MIRASELTLSRGGREILKGFSLDIHPGRTIAIIGPNGSGKSTLIGALVGDLLPAKGAITIDEKPLHSHTLAELAKMRAVTSQQQRFSLAYRVDEVLKMAIRYSGSEETIFRAVIALDIEPLLPRKVTSLSGGEQQRVSIAMALAQGARNIFLDEPFSAQDLESTQRITHHLQRVVSEGVSIVIVAHMQRSELQWCDQIVSLVKN